MIQKPIKPVFLSALFLVLAFLTLSSASFWTGISEGLSPTNAFNWTIFKTFGVLFASNYIFLAPYILAGLFLALSAYFGIKALRNAETSPNNRWMALISTVLATSTLVIAASFVLAGFFV